MINETMINRHKKYNCDIALPCFDCRKPTTQRVETTINLDEVLGEISNEEGRPNLFYAPICDECLNKIQ